MCIPQSFVNEINNENKNQPVNYLHATTVTKFEVAGYPNYLSLISKSRVVTSKTGRPPYIFAKFQHAANNEGNPFEAFSWTDVLLHQLQSLCSQHKVSAF